MFLYQVYLKYTFLKEERVLEQLARIFIFLEMLFVNLITSHLCSQRKYSIIRIVGVLTLFTVSIFLFAFLTRFKFQLTYVNGGFLILLGLTYFFPLKYLYHESSSKTLAIMFFSWIHTMTVTYLSIQITSSFALQNQFKTALIIQTLIYFFSTPVIINFANNKFLYILKNIPSVMNKYLIMLSLVEFATVSIIIVYFRESSNTFWKVIIVVLIAITAAISYHLIYIIVKIQKV